MSRIDHPRVTIVMTARERYALTLATIDSIVCNTSAPYRFIYLDIQSPDWLREQLRNRPELEVVRFDEPLWPQQARAGIAGSVETDYVVFIDNDVQVEPGWLDALVACADDTGAGVVGPLYLWGDGTTPKPDEPEPNKDYDRGMTDDGEIDHGYGDIDGAICGESAGCAVVL